MDDFSIRLYEPADHDAVLHLHRLALEGVGAYAESGNWDEDLQRIQKVYFDDGGIFLVGAIGDRIVAMGAMQRLSAHKAMLRRLRVLPEFQGRGFGQRMLTAREDRALSKGYFALCCDTTSVQVAMQHLLFKNHYVETGRTKGPRFDTIFYEKDLTGDSLSERRNVWPRRVRPA